MTSVPNRIRHDGFTLVEILIVVAIITLVMAAAIPMVSQVTSQRINSTTREFVGTVRTIRNDAVLLNVIYRLVVNMDDQTYWVEAQQQLKPITEITEDSDPDQPVEASDFAIVEKYGAEPKKIASGVVIQGVYKEREGKYTEGVAYIHFFPNGFNERATIYLNKQGSEALGYAIDMIPPAGQVEIFRESIKNAGRT